jgi:hypothetical protein
MTDKPPLFAILDELIERWCDRRELGALAGLLPSYTAFTGLTDAWVDLFEALRTLRAWGRDRLPDDEVDLLGEAIAHTYQSLKSAGVNVGFS